MARISASDATVTMPDWMSAIDVELELRLNGFSREEILEMTREEGLHRYWMILAKRGGL